MSQKLGAESQSSKPKKRLEAGATQAESTFYRKLITEDPEEDCLHRFFLLILLIHSDSACVADEELFGYVKTLTPAAIDLEIRALVTLEALEVFLNALTQRLRSHRDFEAVETFMSVVLRLHADVFTENPELQQALEKLQGTQAAESKRVLDLIASSLGALGFVRDVL